MDLKDYLNSQKPNSNAFSLSGSDLLLAFALVSIVALMVLPVATWMLDALVAVNIIFGLLLVLMGIYINSPLQFSVFPSVLLISTLYRLALSVATTRMILLNGDAGAIIDAFGGFVAGGNIIVGLVVFLIITIVQFIVIAKGAERVAEVGARFSLDAMPGKQMSIDSDLRSGLLTKDEARSKRHDLEMEAKLHGSMDGAMKFVKGDAIAGIIIIIVNLLGGLAVGVLQLDMAFGDAVSRYSVLTVGDGMVAQIPALLGALSAGLIVTRVTDTKKSDQHLGDSIKEQFSTAPRAIVISGALCFLLALVPGFPFKTFLVLGALFFLAGVFLTPHLKSRMQHLSAPIFSILQRKNTPRAPNFGVLETSAASALMPVILIVSRSWENQMASYGFHYKIEQLRASFEHDLGVVLPELKLCWEESSSGSWMLLANEVPLVSNKYTSVDDCEKLYDCIQLTLKKHIGLFIGLQETADLIGKTSSVIPDVVREAMRVVSMQGMSKILKNLVEEGVSIRNMRTILEAIVDAGQHEKDVNNLTEYVRTALGRQTCHAIAPNGVMRICQLDSELETFLSGCVRIASGKVQLSIDPKEGELLVEHLSDVIRKHKPDALITNIQLRRCLRILVELRCFETPVLSQSEVDREIKIEVLESIKMPQPKMLNSA